MILPCILSLAFILSTHAGSELKLEGVNGGSAVLWSYSLPNVPNAPTCHLSVTAKPGGAHEVEDHDCAAALYDAIEEAVESWTFVSVVPSEGQDHVSLYILLVPGTDGSASVIPGNGMAGGTLGATLGAEGDAGATGVHWSEVEVLHRVPPKMPDAARRADITEEKCNIRFFIDEQGVPYDVKAEDCPDMFVASAMEAAWQ